MFHSPSSKRSEGGLLSKGVLVDLRGARFVLPLAGAMFFLSLLFPIWTVVMKAPTYPERSLAIRVYANKFEGDVEEWNRVGRLVGVRVPPPIPAAAFTALPVAFAALGGLTILAWRRRQLRLPVACAAAAVLIACLAWAQYSLYLFGHNLDPERPLRFLKPFTPPVIGILTMGKITTYHLPHVGGVLVVVATTLLLWSAWTEWRGRAKSAYG